MLVFLFLANTAGATLEAKAQNPSRVKHIYIEEGVERLVILSDRYSFKKEVEEFRNSRRLYALLWTGIVAAFVVYIDSRGR